MKKIVALLLALCMVFALVACSSSKSTAETTTAAAAETTTTAAAAETTTAAASGDTTTAAASSTGMAAADITVAGIVFQDDQFMNMLTKGYQDAAKAAGVKSCLTDNTNNDQAKETELINTYLAQGVNGLAIAPLNGDASVAALKAADEKGMKIALTNIDLKDADFIVAGYTSNDYNNCYLAGTEAAKIIKQKMGDTEVKLGIVQFKSLLPDNSGNRVKGYETALTDGGVKFTEVANQDAWLQDTALETASAMLTAHPEINVIIAVNDGGTIGSVMAVQNAGLSDKVLVFGHDGSDQISSMILDDKSPLQCVVAQDPYGQGYKSMTALINAIEGQDYSATKGKCTYLDGIVLSNQDKDAVNKWRVDQGFAEIK